MTDRLLDHFPKLPEPVVDKMLTMEADELNLLLEYPEVWCHSLCLFFFLLAFVPAWQSLGLRGMNAGNESTSERIGGCLR